jgi:Ca-activated chloride channel family protein
VTFDATSAWFLLLLAVVPLAAWRLFSRPAPGVAFGSVQTAAGLGPTLKQRLHWILPALRLASIALLVAALARPLQGLTLRTVESEGIAIQMVVDRSGSMQAEDFELAGRPVDRLTAVKDVGSRFVAGDGSKLAGRTADLVGLIAFARYADSLAPLTSDHAYVVGRLQELRPADQYGEDGTAIGDSIGLAVEKLHALDDSREQQGQEPLESEIIILLTDGDNNAGELDPIAAAELAATLGIKVYTIGVGAVGPSPFPTLDPSGGFATLQWATTSIDEDTLRKIAAVTGGKYFRASDTATLESVYQEIDQLEKSRIEERQFADYREWAVEPIHLGALPLPPLALVAFVLLTLEAALSHSVFREFP